MQEQGGGGDVAVHLDGQQDTSFGNEFDGDRLSTVDTDVENATLINGGGTLSGNDSANVLTTGGAGEVDGLGGNDTIYAKNGAANTIDGGAGTDTAYVDPTGDTTVNVRGPSSGPARPTPTVHQLTGTTIGTAGSYKNQGNTAAKATDGSPEHLLRCPDRQRGLRGDRPGLGPCP